MTYEFLYSWNCCDDYPVFVDYYLINNHITVFIMSKDRTKEELEKVLSDEYNKRCKESIINFI